MKLMNQIVLNALNGMSPAIRLARYCTILDYLVYLDMNGGPMIRKLVIAYAKFASQIYILKGLLLNLK